MALNIPLVSCWIKRRVFFINRTKNELQKNQQLYIITIWKLFAIQTECPTCQAIINIWQLNKLTYCFARTMEILKIGGEKRDSYSSILFSANCFTFQQILTGYHQCKNLRNNIYLYFSDQSIINRMWRYATIISITYTICMFQLNVIVYYCFFFLMKILLYLYFCSILSQSFYPFPSLIIFSLFSLPRPHVRQVK